jgi:Cd2+/Zn2+-exporting ATPase/Cu+-exporting ATPase
MASDSTLEIPIAGMDCAECTRQVQRAIASVPGVETVEVYLAAEKAILRHQGDIDITAIRRAVRAAGYSVPDKFPKPVQTDHTRSISALLGILFGAVLLLVIAGEWLGLLDAAVERIPWSLGLAGVLLIGFPVFVKVVQAAVNRQIIAHTLMMVGVLAAVSVGEWTTAAVVAFFMRIGDYVERFTAERARRAVKDMSAIAPQSARVVREGNEYEVPLDQVDVGEIVVVRPGEAIPVDGEVIAGHAVVDQAAITGESMPVEAGPGSRVFAATLARQGSLRVRATQVGRDTTFGRVIRMVEEAEAQRGEIQRLADRFSGYYLPAVIGVAAGTYLFNQNPLSATAVLVVACSCAFALATPIAILASVGAGARRGLLIKGGKYLEILPKADVLLIDKTGTLTLGKPEITDIYDYRLPPLPGVTIDDSSALQSEIRNHNSTIINQQSSILGLAASAEHYSEHPLAEAIRKAAEARHLELQDPEEFEAIPGLGVRAKLNGVSVSVGNLRLAGSETAEGELPGASQLLAQGKTLLYVAIDGHLAGVLAAADTLRPEVPEAIAALSDLGISRIELLTGDSEASAAALAGELGIPYRAALLPEDKIAIVKNYQEQGHTVVMVGDGVNDAPALALADVGIAMGDTRRTVAMEAAHIVLLREDWALIPELFRIARRTMRVVKMNIGFTVVYNLAGLTLAALGLIPPVLAAAAQSLPDLAILANSSRLIRQK